MTKNKKRYIWAIYHGFGIWQYFEFDEKLNDEEMLENVYEQFYK